MNIRIGFLKLATLAAVAAAASAPATAQAQTNRGQVVQAVVKLNQAQLAFALASFSRPNERKISSGKICFDVGFAQGCIAW